MQLFGGPLPVMRSVEMLKSREPPSSWELEVRSMRGHIGQGVEAARSSGGRGMISKFVTLFAPWRCEVPMQSEPVSPPPSTTTCRSVAMMASVVGT